MDIEKIMIISLLGPIFSTKIIPLLQEYFYEDRVTYRVNPELNGCTIDAEAFIKIYTENL